MTYIANTDKQRQEMLRKCGISSEDDLFSSIPASLQPKSFSIPRGRSELEGYSFFKKLIANS